MKKLLLLFAAVCALNVMAQTSVKMKTSKAVGDEFSFIVNNGLECVIDWGDGKSDTIMSTTEPIVGTLTGKTVTLKTNGLTFLDCSGQQINQLDFVACTGLKTLIISNNKVITCKSITSLTSLQTLWCDQNMLTSLDLSKQTKLESLMAGTNLLAKITAPADGFADLTDIWINKNRFETLDLTNSKKIQTINVENNKLESMKLSRLSDKAIAAFIDGNALDFTSFWNKINVKDWYGTTQTIPFDNSSYNMDEQFSFGREMYGNNQDGTDLAISSYTYSWYPYTNGVKGEKLKRGSETSTTEYDYTTPNTSDQKHMFTFKRPFKDIQLEIKNNKYFNFLIVSNHISILDPTAVNDATHTEGLRCKAANGAVILEADQPTEVKIYDTAATLRWQGTIHNATRIPLGKGIFLINNKKIKL